MKKEKAGCGKSHYLLYSKAKRAIIEHLPAILHQLCLSVLLWNLWTMLFAGFCFSIARTSIKNQRNASLITRAASAKF